MKRKGKCHFQTQCFMLVERTQSSRHNTFKEYVFISEFGKKNINVIHYGE